MSSPQRPGAPRSSSRQSPRAGARRATGPSTGPVRTGARRPQRSAARDATPRSPRITASKPRGSWAAMLTWRTAVLLGVVILAAAVVLPSVRVYLGQQEELRVLRLEAEQARTEVRDLEGEVARWDDPAYVQAQARERLTYVFPGEVPYRVIDPAFVTTHAEGSIAAERTPEALAGDAWFEVMWDSIVVAGNGEPEEPEAVEPAAPGERLIDIDLGR